MLVEKGLIVPAEELELDVVGPPESRGGTETAAFVIEEGQAVSSSSMRLAGQHRADIRAGGRGTMWIEAEIMHE